jgi:hypothetical protein
MMRLLRRAAPVAAVLPCIFLHNEAYAGIAEKPRVESTCLHNLIVLRPQEGWSIDDAAPGVKVPLVRVEVCTEARRACVLNGDEVPMSQCEASG